MTQARLAAIGELVRRTYEDPRVVARYVEVGLWPAEELLVLEYVGDSDRILDLGCGAGRTSVALAELGLEVVGVDLSEAMVEAARDQASLAAVEIEFHVMDATALTFADASFDAVLFSYNGLELVPGLAGKEQVLRQVRRVLRPGGVFLFTTHSIFALNVHAPYRFLGFLRYACGRLFGWPVREQELGERFIDDDDEEVRYLQVLPPSRYLRLLRRCGFQVLSFNTRDRLEAGRRWSWRGVFEDGERIYAARRT
jgi:ubiquinone/menaquinone biosynthesis C-methylase UbiE